MASDWDPPPTSTSGSDTPTGVAGAGSQKPSRSCTVTSAVIVSVVAVVAGAGGSVPEASTNRSDEDHCDPSNWSSTDRRRFGSSAVAGSTWTSNKVTGLGRLIRAWISRRGVSTARGSTVIAARSCRS